MVRRHLVECRIFYSLLHSLDGCPGWLFYRASLFAFGPITNSLRKRPVNSQPLSRCMFKLTRMQAKIPRKWFILNCKLIFQKQPYFLNFEYTISKNDPFFTFREQKMFANKLGKTPLFSRNFTRSCVHNTQVECRHRGVATWKDWFVWCIVRRKAFPIYFLQF